MIYDLYFEWYFVVNDTAAALYIRVETNQMHGVVPVCLLFASYLPAICPVVDELRRAFAVPNAIPMLRAREVVLVGKI